MNNETFNLDHQFNLYLKRMNLQESTMSEVQKTETKRAFMGGMAQMLMLIRNDNGNVPDEELLEGCQSMLRQLDTFWTKQIVDRL